MSHDHPVPSTTDFAFVKTLLRFNSEYAPHTGDIVEMAYSEITAEKDGPLPKGLVTVASAGKKTLVLRSKKGQEYKVLKEGYFTITESPTINEALEKTHHEAIPDGVAFSDSCVPAALTRRLRKQITALAAAEPVDYHPGSGTRVRDLVHPSLYPYVEKKSKAIAPLPKRPDPEPEVDRFGRNYESSTYQWLPTPFRIAKDGTTEIASYINNLDPETYAGLYGSLAELFTSALPLIEGVLGYVDATQFWQKSTEDDDDDGSEGDLPDAKKIKRRAVKRRSVRGKELLVIPKIVDYRLGEGETHEGVWHVEGMSHEHIVATCVFVLDRDKSLQGGDLSFKRAYTLEEAGLLFWNMSQTRPAAIDTVVEQGAIPVGSVATPAGRVVVFPNSHIHKLNALTVAPGAAEGRRRVIVFWVVDPEVKIPSTREIPPQQGTITRKEALKIRLALMKERRLHKASFNLRAVSLCEH